MGRAARRPPAGARVHSRASGSRSSSCRRRDATPAYPTPRAWHMLSDAIASVQRRPLARAGRGIGRRSRRRRVDGLRASARCEAPSLEAIAAGTAACRAIPSSSISSARAASRGSARASRADGELAAKVVTALGAASKEVAVWAVDAALARAKQRRPRRSPRSRSTSAASGAQVLVDVLRLGRFAREGAVK